MANLHYSPTPFINLMDQLSLLRKLSGSTVPVNRLSRLNEYEIFDRVFMFKFVVTWFFPQVFLLIVNSCFLVCVQVGAIFWGFWAVHLNAANYYRARITRINSTHVDFTLLLNNKLTRSYRRTDQVLIIDKVPSIGDVSPNSSVIANQFNNRDLRWYRTGHADHTSGDSFVFVNFDDGKGKLVPLERVRLVSRPRFCSDVK